jgi:hypothetical protein
MSVITGKVAFVNLEEYEIYQGQSTGKYSVVVTLDDAEASKLEEQGVNLREYEGNKQRKFASKFSVDVVDLDGEPETARLTRGSLIRIQYSTGQPHPVHGITPYLDKIRVLELANQSDDDF